MATAVALGASVLRFDMLGARPFWADERAVDAFVARAEHESYRVAAMPSASGQLTESHLAPLHVALSYASAHVLGRSAVALRLPSALASIATVLLVIALGTSLYDRRVGLVAGALVAISPYQIEYAQNARSYALFVALSCAQLLAWFRFAATHRMRWLGAFTLSGVASAYAHHLGLLNQAAFAVLALATAAADRIASHPPTSHRAFGRREILLLAAAFAAIGLLYLPQLASFTGFLHSGVAEPLVRLAPSLRFAHELAGLWGGGRGAPALLYEALFAIGVVAGLRAGWPVASLVWWIACPILVFSVVPFSKFFDARYLSAGQPAFLLLVALGAVALVDALAAALRTRAPARARTLALAGAAALALAVAWPAATGYRDFRRLPLRCGEFFLEPRILDLAGGFCRRHIVMNTLVPEDRYLLRAAAPDVTSRR
ncbi:MAG TPA: glycosyltransferase family 39 protein [Myxococcota bacterium]|nr:glycosyltransferase family 39 protein [Myxococcota bacterium]